MRALVFVVGNVRELWPSLALQGPSYGEAPDAPWMTLREHCIWRDSPLLHAIVQGKLVITPWQEDNGYAPLAKTESKARRIKTKN